MSDFYGEEDYSTDHPMANKKWCELEGRFCTPYDCDYCDNDEDDEEDY